MRRKLNVAVTETGIPFARIPKDDMWQVVEFLACQRLRVSYTYDADHFNVYFLHTDQDAAQRLLDSWTEVEREEDPIMRPHGADWIVGHAR